jgi:putative endonuclease
MVESGWRMAENQTPSAIRYPVLYGEVAERLNAAVLPPPAKRRGPASLWREKSIGTIIPVWSVYVLQSEKSGRYYTGYAEDLKRRLKQHNDGKTKSLKAHLPDRVVCVEEFSSQQEAYRRER